MSSFIVFEPFSTVEKPGPACILRGACRVEKFHMFVRVYILDEHDKKTLALYNIVTSQVLR